MNRKRFKCVKVIFSDFAKEIGALRRESWATVEGFNKKAFPKKVWVDGLDESSIHWAVFDNEKIIASARLGIYSSYTDIPYMEMMESYKSLLELPVASLNRLVVSPEYRGYNISKLLDEIRVEEAREKGAKTIVGQAIHFRIKVLENLGFKYIADIGSIEELPNIDLSFMVKQL